MTKQNINDKKIFQKNLEIVLKHNNKPCSEEILNKICRYLVTQEHKLNHIACMRDDAKYYKMYWINGINPKQEHIEKLTLAYIEKHIGCKAYTQRDPRGIMIRLYLNIPETNYFHNNFDGETSGVTWV